MKKQLPAVLFALVAVALAAALFSAKRENAELKQTAADLATAPAEPVAAASSEPVAAEPAIVPVQPEIAVATPPPMEANPAPEEQETAVRRMMGNMAKMMENPTMNKVMEASQRGAVGALYSDLIEYLNLDAEETKYFMDLLMYRQMKNIDMAMKMMGGNLGEDEKKALADEAKQAEETLKAEMEKFLNNPDDLAEWEFYEKTMGERMMLSQMDQSLAASNATLADDTYRNLLGMMHEEKKNFPFTSDLHDEKNTDLSPSRFSKDNIQSYANDVRQLNDRITARAQSLLTPEQYTAFEASIKTTTDMQLSQLEMAAQMFGAEEAPTAP